MVKAALLRGGLRQSCHGDEDGAAVVDGVADDLFNKFGERWAEATRSWYGTSKCSKIFVHFWAIGRSEEDPNKMVTSMLIRRRGGSL